MDRPPSSPSLADIAAAVAAAPHAAILGVRVVALLAAHRYVGEAAVRLARIAGDTGMGERTLRRSLADLRGYGALRYRLAARHGLAELDIRPVDEWTTLGGLILGHQQLVRETAAREARRLPRWVSIDEHIANGQVGLLEAAQRYNVFSPIPFQAYARRRVRGAIIDAYRRRAYAWELSEELPPEDAMPPLDMAQAEAAAISASRRAVIERALARLPDDMAAIARTYLDDEPLDAYAARAGISPSSACIRRQNAIAQLRAVFADMGVGLEALG